MCLCAVSESSLSEDRELTDFFLNDMVVDSWCMVCIDVGKTLGGSEWQNDATWDEKNSGWARF